MILAMIKNNATKDNDNDNSNNSSRKRGLLFSEASAVTSQNVVRIFEQLLQEPSNKNITYIYIYICTHMIYNKQMITRS